MAPVPLPPGVIAARHAECAANTPWKRLPPGTLVTVLGYRARDGSLSASGGSVTLPDGSSLNATDTGAGAPQ